jgi:hypothetical protein
MVRSREKRRAKPSTALDQSRVDRMRPTPRALHSAVDSPRVTRIYAAHGALRMTRRRRRGAVTTTRSDGRAEPTDRPPSRALQSQGRPTQQDSDSASPTAYVSTHRPSTRRVRIVARHSGGETRLRCRLTDHRDSAASFVHLLAWCVQLRRAVRVCESKSVGRWCARRDDVNGRRSGSNRSGTDHRICMRRVKHSLLQSFVVK